MSTTETVTGIIPMDQFNLDRQPVCEVKWGFPAYDQDCDDPATWVITKLCCGRVSLACDHHAQNRIHNSTLFRCLVCWQECETRVRRL